MNFKTILRYFYFWNFFEICNRFGDIGDRNFPDFGEVTGDDTSQRGSLPLHGNALITLLNNDSPEAGTILIR